MKAITVINLSFVELQRHWRHLKGFPDSSVGQESACNAGHPSSIPGLGRFAGDRLPPSVFLGFPCGSAGKESFCNVGDLVLIPGLERSPGECKGYSLQYSVLENSMNCTVHGVTKELDMTEKLSLWRHYMGINYIKYAKINTFNQNK